VQFDWTAVWYKKLAQNRAAYIAIRCTVAVLGKNIWGGGWPLIIWEATTAKRNYYRTN